MIEIEKPTIEVFDSAEDGTYGKFVVEPLERGYGMTLGNSLRRVLLSSLEGAAVTSIKIDGVQHEFSTIPGVKEDVTEIVLNMKGLISKLHSELPKFAYIEVDGPCEVTAADIKAVIEVSPIPRVGLFTTRLKDSSSLTLIANLKYAITSFTSALSKKEFPE